MHNLQLRNLLSAVALSALLPLSLTACDDGGSGSGSGDGSTGGSSDTNETNDAATATVTVTDTTPTTVTDTTPTTGDSDPTTGDTEDPTTGVDTTDTEETTGDTEETTGDTEETTGDTEEPTTGGMSECQMVDVGDVLRSGDYNGLWGYENQGELSGAMEPDAFQVRFYDIGDGPVGAGDVDLAVAPEDNFASCETCILHFEDIDGEGNHARLYYQAMGTVGVSESVDTLTSELTFTNVRLVEVEIDDMANSVPVEDGECIDIVDTTSRGVPVGWDCDPAAFGDTATCDCGCGVVDPDCADDTAGSCDACNGEGSCAADGADCSTIAEDDNTSCIVPGWNCDPSYYGADDGCDCGCGIADPDCGGDMTLDACGFCSNAGSCSTQACDGNTEIDPVDNAVCL